MPAGRTQLTRDLVDVNGDGLPDIVSRDATASADGRTVEVQYNLGNRHGRPEPFGTVAAPLREPIGGFEEHVEGLALGLDLASTRHLRNKTMLARRAARCASFEIRRTRAMHRKASTRGSYTPFARPPAPHRHPDSEQVTHKYDAGGSLAKGQQQRRHRRQLCPGVLPPSIRRAISSWHHIPVTNQILILVTTARSGEWDITTSSDPRIDWPQIAKDLVWKRVIGGLCGIGSTVAVLLLLRQAGASGESVQQWETAIVSGAGTAGIVLWLVKRRQRRQP